MTILYGFLVLLVLSASWYLVPFALRWLSSRKLRQYCREQGAIVLTYDDGPSGQLLPRLLKLLEEHKVHATFFLLGRNVELHQDAVRKLLDDGHEVGCHTFHHSNAWKSWPWHSARDLAKGLMILRNHGVLAEVFRPPYGKATLATLADCRLRKLRLGWWTIDSQDVWKRRPISEVLCELKTQGGGVVLMHDLDRADGLPHSDYILDLTDDVIDFASKSGLRIQRLSDIYAKASE